MRYLDADSLARARQFVLRNGRLLDRLRFQHFFETPQPDRVVAALRPYQNADGGFGNALEPDLRGALSLPVPVEAALRILDEVDRFSPPLVGPACDFLSSITTDSGGVPFVLRDAEREPHAFWWEGGDDTRAALNPTAALAGLLHKHGVEHPWLEPAAAFCRAAIDDVAEAGPYDAVAILEFLEHAPDRTWAEAAFVRLRPTFLGCVELDPTAAGEVHFPLDLAPAPGTLAGRLFDASLLDQHLDHLIATQREDGGWDVNFPIWNPLNGFEWRTIQTVGRLRTLRAYGRLAL